jgi:hypothetical protein
MRREGRAVGDSKGRAGEEKQALEDSQGGRFNMKSVKCAFYGKVLKETGLAL